MRFARRLLAVLVRFVLFLLGCVLRVADVVIICSVLIVGFAYSACDVLELWADRLVRR